MDLVFQYATAGLGRFDTAEAVTKHRPVDNPHAFPQRPGMLDALLGQANGEVPQSLNAYQLRVQAKQGLKNAPVLVFIPGGGFLSGTGMARWFTQSGKNDSFIQVTVNYPLGILGHFGPTGDPAESDRPLRALVLALKWVKSYIHNYGGDPENITLAGDSAGAWYSYALATLPETRGLFRRLALISLPREAPLSKEAYLERWNVAQELLADSGGIASAPVEEVLDAQIALAQRFAGRGMALMPAVSPNLPAELHDFERTVHQLHVDEIALMVTEHETQAFLHQVPEAAFSQDDVVGYAAGHFKGVEAVHAWLTTRDAATPKQQMTDLMTLYQFHLAQFEVARAGSLAGKRVYAAQFSVPSLLTGGSPHCMTLPFVFGNRQQWQDAPMLSGLSDQLFDQTAAAVRGWLQSFVHDGSPGYGNARDTQPPFDVVAPQRLVFVADTGRQVTTTLAHPAEWKLTTR